MREPAPKWVQFHNVSAEWPERRKTAVWGVVAKQGGTYIGRVAWYGAWRCYAFFPEPYTAYEQRCLRDIAYFLRYQMALRRRARAS